MMPGPECPRILQPDAAFRFPAPGYLLAAGQLLGATEPFLQNGKRPAEG